jgi:hypothetical protein
MLSKSTLYTMHSLSKRSGYMRYGKSKRKTIKTSTSCISSGLESNAAPIPPLSEKDFGQPMLISIAATSWHLERKKYCGQTIKEICKAQVVNLMVSDQTNLCTKPGTEQCVC